MSLMLDAFKKLNNKVVIVKDKDSSRIFSAKIVALDEVNGVVHLQSSTGLSTFHHVDEFLVVRERV